MTHEEIKKLYTKTKKAYEKRTGEKFTWVMNAKQQRLGTATILTGYPVDYESQLASCEQHLADFDTIHWPKRRAEYLQRAKEEARRNDGWTFWQERTTPEGLEECRASMLETYTRERDDRAAKVQQHGTYAEQYDRAVKEAEEMIQSPEIQSFLEAIGGQAFVDIKSHDANDRTVRYAEIYIRFAYKAS